MGLLRTGKTLVTLPTLTTLMGGWAIGAQLRGDLAGAERAAHLWCDGLLGAMGVEVHSKVHPELDPSRTYVFVSNHQSHVDVPVIMKTWAGPIRFVAKRSLASIPVFGRAMRMLGHVIIDRADTQDARRRLVEQVERVRGEVSVLFFAEGTRSRDGALQPFKTGCLYLAEEAGVPVVPIGISGTRAVLRSGSAWVEPGPVGIVFGPPMPRMSDAEVPRGRRIADLREVVGSLAAEAERLRRG